MHVCCVFIICDYQDQNNLGEYSSLGYLTPPARDGAKPAELRAAQCPNHQPDYNRVKNFPENCHESCRLSLARP